MAFKVTTSKAAWAGFVKRAKNDWRKSDKPDERCEALFGHETPGCARVTDFVPIKMNKGEGETDNDTCDYDDAELHRLRELAKSQGKTLLGTIHTHPDRDYDPSGSTTDHHVAAKDGERIMGVCVIYKDKKTGRFKLQTEWWFPQPKITFELLD